MQKLEDLRSVNIIMKTNDTRNKNNYPNTIIMRIPAKYATEEVIYDNAYKDKYKNTVVLVEGLADEIELLKSKLDTKVFALPHFLLRSTDTGSLYYYDPKNKAYVYMYGTEAAINEFFINTCYTEDAYKINENLLHYYKAVPVDDAGIVLHPGQMYLPYKPWVTCAMEDEDEVKRYFENRRPMMASRAIERLQELIDKYGDMPIAYEDVEMGNFLNVEEIEIHTAHRFVTDREDQVPYQYTTFGLK